MEGYDANFCYPFDDNLWLGQGGLNPVKWSIRSTSYAVHEIVGTAALA